MPQVLILIILFLTSWAHGSARLDLTCPEQFIGRVNQIKSDQNNSNRPNHLARMKISFENLKTIKGHVKKSPVIKVLKYAQIKFDTDKTYRIHMRNGLLCKMEEIASL